MIYSPSYKRCDGVKTHLILPEVIYCVHEFEADDYKKKGFKVEVLPDSLKGNIARVRNYILDNFINDKGVIIDDDIEDVLFWSSVDGDPVQEPVKDIIDVIERGFLLCEDWGLKLWGVNVVSDKGSYREYTPFSTSSYISASLMGFVKNDLRFDESIPLKEDYDYVIQNCNKYRGALRLNMFSLKKKDHKNLGGCADYRNMIVERDNFDRLRDKWGSDIVKEDLKSSKKQKAFDLNPIIRIPIKGV